MRILKDRGSTKLRLYSVCILTSNVKITRYSEITKTVITKPDSKVQHKEVRLKIEREREIEK